MPDTIVQNGAKQCIENEIDREKSTTDDSRTDLSDRQLAAIDLFLCGASDVAIAQSLGVHRNTIRRWRTQDEQFREHLVRRRAELYDSTLDRFRAMLSAALEVLDQQVHDVYAPTALRAARTLLYMARIGQSVTDFSSASAALAKPLEPPTSDNTNSAKPDDADSNKSG